LQRAETEPGQQEHKQSNQFNGKRSTASHFLQEQTMILTDQTKSTTKPKTRNESDKEKKEKKQNSHASHSFLS